MQKLERFMKDDNFNKCYDPYWLHLWLYFYQPLLCVNLWKRIFIIRKLLGSKYQDSSWLRGWNTSNVFHNLRVVYPTNFQVILNVVSQDNWNGSSDTQKQLWECPPTPHFHSGVFQCHIKPTVQIPRLEEMWWRRLWELHMRFKSWWQNHIKNLFFRQL